MVKNTTGGNKAKSKARKDVIKVNDKARDDLIKTEGQEYAVIIDVRTAKEMHLLCYDKKQRLGIVRGRLFYKRVKFAKGNVVLISLRGFEDSKCDILHKYDDDDIRELIRMGEITYSFVNDFSGSDKDKKATIASTVIMTMDDVGSEKINTDDVEDSSAWFVESGPTKEAGKDTYIGSIKEELNLDDIEHSVDIKKRETSKIDYSVINIDDI
jgi:translation initiation factor 1A